MFDTRMALPEDAPLIAAHRRAMFAAMGGHDPALLDAMTAKFEPWVRRMTARGKYLGWITEEIARGGDRPVASAGLLILDWPPHPLDPAGEYRGYLLNVYTDADYRKQGHARALVACCMAEAKKRSMRVVALHASDEGRKLYQRFGFQTTNELLHAEPIE